MQTLSVQTVFDLPEVALNLNNYFLQHSVPTGKVLLGGGEGPRTVRETFGRTKISRLDTTNSMNTAHSIHQFAEAATAQIQELRSNDCQLIIRQKPENARVAVGKEKDRKPVDPPPIIQLKISNSSDPTQNYLQSPYFFMSCSLVGSSEGVSGSGTLGAALAGTLVSSLHRLKDTDNSDGAFFVFGDLSVKVEGTFRLQFNLFEMRDDECYHIQSIQSDPFIVHPTKNFPGMSESTFLTRSFSDQGVRLRLRKEPRTLLRKRGPASEDYQPRHYRTQTGHQPQRDHAQQQERGSIESQDNRRHSLVEQSGTMQSLPMHSHTYDQRQHMGRGYSHQPSGSFGTYSDEVSTKRPRTGSEPSQPQSFESHQYPGRIYTDPQVSAFGSPFTQQASQQQTYGYSYTQSPQATTVSRDQYFSQRLQTQSGNSSPFESSHQRSPNSAFFATQPQGRYQTQQQPQYHQTSQLLTPSSPQRVHSAFESLGIATRAQSLAGMGESGMGPPTYGRMNTAPAYGSLTTPSMVRRDTYDGFHGQTFSAGGLGSGLMVSESSGRGTSIITTSAPGNLENPF